MTYPIPTHSDGDLIDEIDWNLHVTALNDLNTRLTTAEGSVSSQGTRITTLETNQGTRGSLGTVYSEITTLRNALGIPWSGGTALSRLQSIETNLGTWSGGTAISRIQTLETRTTDASTGNSALGTRVTTLEGKVTATSAQPSFAASAVDAQFNTQSTSYTSGPTGGTLPGVSFTCPPSGRILVLIDAEIWSGGTGLAKCAAAIKTSAGGTDVIAASNLYALAKYNTDSIQATKSRLITSGLTPGTTYYAQVQMASRESAINAWVKNPSITVIPLM